jgi:hypothetical protein
VYVCVCVCMCAYVRVCDFACALHLTSPFFTSPCFPLHCLTLIFLQNVGSGDIVAGNERIVLGLIWTLILKYQINSHSDAPPLGTAPDGATAHTHQQQQREQPQEESARASLLQWVRAHVGPGTKHDMDVRNFTSDFRDGLVVCALVDAIAPGVLPGVCVCVCVCVCVGGCTRV